MLLALRKVAHHRQRFEGLLEAFLFHKRVRYLAAKSEYRADSTLI